MQLRTSTMAAVCVLAAGFALGGCKSSNSSSSSGGSAKTPAANSGSTTQATGAAPAQNAQGAENGDTCQAENLSFALGAKTKTAHYPGQTTQAVDLTNKGSSACTMDGFPGVDLVGVARGQIDYSWSLDRQSASYSEVTLQPGRTAHFDLLYLPSAAGASGNITVVKMVVTPPNDYTQAEVTWNQSVLLQDGATHPGTYISPVVSGP